MRHELMALLLVFIGGGIGSMLRHGVNRAAALAFGVSFPWGTMVVNVAGGLAIGMLAGWFAARAGTGQPLRLFLTTGLLGGFTTFSAFSLDAVTLWQRGQPAQALFYVFASVGLAILGVFAGLMTMRGS